MSASVNETFLYMKATGGCSSTDDTTSVPRWWWWFTGQKQEKKVATKEDGPERSAYRLGTCQLHVNVQHKIKA